MDIQQNNVSARDDGFPLWFLVIFFGIALGGAITAYFVRMDAKIPVAVISLIALASGFDAVLDIAKRWPRAARQAIIGFLGVFWVSAICVAAYGMARTVSQHPDWWLAWLIAIGFGINQVLHVIRGWRSLRRQRT